METQKGKLYIISTILKNIYNNPNIHRNILRKMLVNSGKVSKSKFSMYIEQLIALGEIELKNENLSLNQDRIELAVVHKDKNETYIVTSNSNKHYSIDNSISQMFNHGELVNVAMFNFDSKLVPIILGKNDKVVGFDQNFSRKTSRPTSLFETQKIDSSGSMFFDRENLLLGRVIKISHNNLVFIPNRKSIEPRQIPILNDEEEFSKFQDKICVMKLSDSSIPILGGVIVDVKGDAGNPIHEYDAIAESYNAIMSWEGEKLNKEISLIPSSVDVDLLDLISESDAKNGQSGKVVDLRQLPFVTVDPATCKDMDDAIYSTFDENGNIVCYTAVANVSKYISLDSEIGKKYINGAFTIYAPNRAYNILPPKLSTGICSLSPNEDRLSFVVKTVIDRSTGDVKNSQIFDAIIRSRQKYSYEEAQQIVDNFDAENMDVSLEYKLLLGGSLSKEEQVLMNYYAAKTIKKGFDKRRMIRFVANNEKEIIFNDDFQDVIDIKPVGHLFYHEVIEAFMITANEATAKFAKEHDLNNIYRIHEKPNSEKVNNASEFFRILGIDFDGDLSAEGTRSLLELVRGSANEDTINNFMIKMQSRAIYSNRLYSSKKDEMQSYINDEISHYALQSLHYSHTTSPIRRVPDYVTQFNILAYMHGTKPLSKEIIKDIIEIANERQIDIDQAEKEFNDISSVIYCEKHIGDKLRGKVTKIRQASVDEGYDDDIIVIVKDDEKGIYVEIPLSQILGRKTNDCSISAQHCAVYDGNGNIVLTLCKPIDFIIEMADRQKMIVVGRTNRAMISESEANEKRGSIIYLNKKRKNKRYKRFEENKKHKNNSLSQQPNVKEYE